MIVVILGMHRSGTSMLSSIVHTLGVNMGPAVDLKRSNPHSQPHGYWEDQGFVLINRQIIKAAGGHWHQPPGRLKILTASMSFRSQIDKVIWERRNLGNWGWKDPRNCLCIECYQYVLGTLPDVRYVQIVRSKKGIVDSLINRGEILSGTKNQRRGWEKVAYEHERRVRDFFNRYQVKRYTISYDDIIKHPEYEMRRLGEFLSIHDSGLIEVATKRVKR